MALKRVTNLGSYLSSNDIQKGFVSYTLVNLERSPLSNIFCALSWLLSTCVRLVGLEELFPPKTKAFTWIRQCNILLHQSYSVCSLWVAFKCLTLHWCSQWMTNSPFAIATKSSQFAEWEKEDKVQREAVYTNIKPGMSFSWWNNNYCTPRRSQIGRPTLLEVSRHLTVRQKFLNELHFRHGVRLEKACLLFNVSCM